MRPYHLSRFRLYKVAIGSMLAYLQMSSVLICLTIVVSLFQGPALYAYNDALFNEQDWKGVRMLSQSIKQDDHTKVGYFGMGFKSVFHLTGTTRCIR